MPASTKIRNEFSQHWILIFTAMSSYLTLPLRISGYFIASVRATYPTHFIVCYITAIKTFFFLWCCGPTRAMASSFLRVLDHTQRRTTVGRTLLDEWSARRRDLYLTTHNTHNRQTSMLPLGFEPTISTGDRSQTHALDRAATGTGTIKTRKIQITNLQIILIFFNPPLLPLWQVKIF